MLLLLLACTGDPDDKGPASPTGTDTDTDPGVPTAITAQVARLPHLSSAAILHLTVDPPVPLTVRCASGDDAWEAEREAAASHTITWYALLSDARYDCVAGAGSTAEPFSFTTDPLPNGLPTPLITGSTTGLTLTNHVMAGVGQKLVVLDPQGRVRWYHWLDGDPNVGVEASFQPETTQGPMFLAGGGEGYAPSLIHLDATVAWRAGASVEGGLWHHETRWLPGEEVLGMSWATNQVGLNTWDGFALETVSAWTGERTWSWSSQTAVDRGQLPPETVDPDAYHANAVDPHPEDPEGSSYFVSVKRLHQVVRLDPATGDVTWHLGAGGDFTLLEANGAPAAEDRWFYGQHAPEAHLRDASGVWDVWLHDNGMDRPDTPAPFSRVLHLEVDVPARTARIVWEWTEPGWYEPVFGDVDLLPDGHLLVTMGHCPQCAGAPEERRTTLLELDEAGDREVWRAEMREPSESSYRAERLDGCALAPESVALCPP